MFYLGDVRTNWNIQYLLISVPRVLMVHKRRVELDAYKRHGSMRLVYKSLYTVYAYDDAWLA